jgi:osmotically-inducible protein OsmY
MIPQSTGTSFADHVARSSPARVSATAQVLGYGLPPALRAVVDRFQERRARTATDRSLARRLHAALVQDRTGASGLALYVHNGAVSIYGTVPSETVREAVLTVAAAQPGVRRIVDHLHTADA